MSSKTAIGFLVLILAIPGTCLGSQGHGFMENAGQLADDVLYYGGGGNASVFFTPSAVILDIGEVPGPIYDDEFDSEFRAAPSVTHRCAISIGFEGANPNPVVEARGLRPGVHNFFVGQDPSRWVTHVESFDEIVYRDLWPGVDLVYSYDSGSLHYETSSDNEANLSAVRFTYDGVEEVVSLPGEGLRIRTSAGDLLDSETHHGEVSGEIKLAHSAAGLASDGSRDDPSTLLWGTFLGGSGYEDPRTAAFDPSGNIVVGGYTWSSDFPPEIGGYDTVRSGRDVLVAKMSADGSTLLWWTYLGGSGVSEECARGLTVDSSGDVIVVGLAPSGFPTTAGAYDPTHNGSFSDGFVCKLSGDGDTLLWSTYLGGSAEEEADEVCVGSGDNIYVTGWTKSTDFPVTSGAFDETHNGPAGGADSFVAMLSSDGSTLSWGTFIGGSGSDLSKDIEVNESDEVFIAGGTTSTDLPSTIGAYDTSWNGGSHDAFLLKLSSSGDDVEWMTYLGGCDTDKAWGLELDSSGQPVICGGTDGCGFPSTPGAFHVDHYHSQDGYISKFSSDGSTLLHSTFWRGYNFGECWDLALDVADNVLFTGRVNGAFWMAVTPDAYASDGHADPEDAFIAKLSSDLSTLMYGSHIPGQSVERPWVVLATPAGDGVCVGYTASADFPTTLGSYDQTTGGEGDVYLLEFDLPGIAENIVCDADPEYLTATTPSKTIDVNYLGGGGGMMYSYSLVVTWDGSLVHTSADSITEGTLLSDAGTTFFNPRRTGENEVTVDCFLLGAGPGVSGPGTMFSIEFTGLSFGTSDIDITIAHVRDSDNSELTGFAEEDGELIVDVEAPVVTGTYIENVTLSHTDDYIKDTDTAQVTATVTDDDPSFSSSNIVANLTGLGGGTSVSPSSYMGGVATWDIASSACNPADGTVTVIVTASDPMGNVTSLGDDIIADNTAPTAVTDFDATPGNGECSLTWTMGTDTYYAGTRVRRYSEAGEYPQYPWFVMNWPVIDSAYPSTQWAGSSVYDGNGTSFVDELVDRNIYYYQAFGHDLAGNYSPPAETARDLATNYWLGDVADEWGSWGYNGLVDDEDILKLGDAYWTSDPVDYPGDAECDVGPTVHPDWHRLGLPKPDDQVEFEDAMIFAMNYGVVTARVVPFLPEQCDPRPLALAIGSSAERSDNVTVALRLEGNSSEVKGLSASLVYDTDELEFVSASLSENMVSPLGEVFFMHRDTGERLEFDVVVLGTGVTIGGSGDVALLTFRSLSESYSLEVESARVRDAGNGELVAKLGELASGEGTPQFFKLVGNTPNPFNPITKIAYNVPRESEVTVRVYDVSGRLVATLVDGVCEAGRHVAVWNGTNDRGESVGSGVYFCTMEAPDFHESRKMTLLK